MTLRYGYEIQLERCGRPERRHVVRQYGEWVSQHLTREEALQAIQDRDGELI